MMQKPLNTIKVLFLGLLLALGISYVQATWVGPTATPPGNNTTAPVNIGSLFQQKTGDFWAKSVGSDNGFCIGISCITGWPQSCPAGQAISAISTTGAVTCVSAGGGGGGGLATSSLPMAKAWGYVKITSGVPTLQSPSFNVASIADTAVGKLTVNLITPFSSANYVVVANAWRVNGVYMNPTILSASSFTIYSFITGSNNASVGNTLVDPDFYFFVVFGQ